MAAATKTVKAEVAKAPSNNTIPRPSFKTVPLLPKQPAPTASTNWVFGLTSPVTDVFEMGKKLGEGGHFGFCKLATEKKTGKVYAVKHILKQRFAITQYDQFRREVAIMERLNHENVIRLHSAYEDAEYLYIAMEFCAGGELFDKIVKKPYSERDAAVLLRQIFESLAYLHKSGIAHCDLKPDNFMFLDPNATVMKVIDFGLSKFTKRRVYFNKYCGTSFYVAPEVCWNEPHFNEACDMWSMGVVTFVMIFGYPPFHDDSDAVIIQLIMQGFDPTVRPGFGAHFPESMPVSSGARDFISRLLELDVAKRMTAEEALAHPWLKGTAASNNTLEATVFSSLKTFLCKPRIKAAVLRLMTDSLSDYEITNLKNTFHQIDVNHDGKVTLIELQAAVSQLGKNQPTPKELDMIMKMADIDGNGTLSYEELMLSYVNKKLTSNEERLWAAFRKLDQDHNGTITAEEVFHAMQVINPKSSKDEMKKMIGEVDVNGDGKLDYEEFLAFMWEKEAPTIVPQTSVDVAPAAAAAAGKTDGKAPTSVGAAASAAGANSTSAAVAKRQTSAPHPIFGAIKAPAGGAGPTSGSAGSAAKPTAAVAATTIAAKK